MDCKFTTVKSNCQEKKKKDDQYREIEILAGTKLSFTKLNKKARAAQRILTEEDQKRLHKEKIQQLRKLNRIYTWGDNVSDPITNFFDLNIPDEIKNNLKDHNIVNPTSIQMQSIPIMLENRNLLATAPTGSGKTLAFAIPLINCCVKLHETLTQEKNKLNFLVAIVLEPTRILAKQAYNHVAQFTKNLSIKCAFLENEFDPETSILITTPNKLLFALDSMNDETREKILEKLKWLIVDESDRIFDNTEGDKSFRLQLFKLINYCNGKETKKAFFSATFSYQIEEWCANNLNNVVMVCIGERNSANSLVEQQLIFAGWEQGKVSALKMLIRLNFNPPALVFVQSKERAKQLFVELKTNFPKLTIDMISSELSNKESDVIVDRFCKGKIHLLVCTELMGRGLDFQNVNLVVNFDLPTSIVSYIHRIGRTGRAGKKGKAITYFTESDMEIVRPIATVIHQSGFSVPEYLLQLKKLPKNKKEKLKKHAPKRKKITTDYKWKSTAKKLRQKQNKRNKKI